ncbi:hypothetical protein [Lentzea aerocolonigenes]|uniref:hypothetical protein n=1 Tax=Lentzea aerocolonigenes TaxID=68170 RepID=UPI0012DF0AAD|nr:hypothetical protein [Lentzea aerocolonigenes]
MGQPNAHPPAEPTGVLRRSTRLAGSVTGTDGAQFDVAFWLGDTFVLCEVKSLPTASETDQLRYGLGQIMEYAALHARQGDEVQSVLYVEQRPSADQWESACARGGVILAWPEVQDRVLGEQPIRTLAAL